jgi:hypothetical protein
LQQYEATFQIAHLYLTIMRGDKNQAPDGQLPEHKRSSGSLSRFQVRLVAGTMGYLMPKFLLAACHTARPTVSGTLAL